MVPALHSTTPDPLSLTPPPSPSVAMAAVSVTLLRRLDKDERGVAGGCGLEGSCDLKTSFMFVGMMATGIL